jgi:hypothetical protein
LFSSSLEGAFALRFWSGAMVVPLAGLILLCCRVQKSLAAILLAIVILSFDAGLIDTLLSSFRGYMAPEFFALATFGYVLAEQKKWWGSTIASVSTIIAAGNHPLALGCYVAVGWLLWKTCQHSKKWFFVAVLSSLLAFLPRLFWLSQLLQCDQGGLACLQGVAFSSSQPLGIHTLWTIFHDRFWIEMGIGGLFLLVGCFLDYRHPLAKWVLLSAFGIGLLGMGISTLRPYHFRILAVPLLCWSICGWMTRPKLLLAIAPFWLFGVLQQAPEPLKIRSNVGVHDRIAKKLCERNEHFWLDGYQTREELGVSLQGVGVSMALQGCGHLFEPTPKETSLVLTRTELPYPIILEEGQYSIYKVNEAAGLFLQSENILSGYDIATLFFPDEQVTLRW